MKTLVFCTSFAAAPEVWESRYAVWVASLRSSGLLFDQLLIVDDASPTIPEWAETEVVEQSSAGTPEEVHSDSPIIIYHHYQRLGRVGLLDFPGWHRSFAFGARYAEAHDFERVVHLESDAHITSERLALHFNNIEAGWLVLWSRKYWFPEMAIQVAAGSQVAEMAAFARKPYAELVGRVHEDHLPYTHVELLYQGDRFGETIDYIPRNVDFAAQVLSNQAAGYLWWLEDAVGKRSPLNTLGAPFRIGHAELSEPGLFDGDWSWPEPGYRWMIDYDSRLRLPPAVGAQVISLDLRPFLDGLAPGYQWLLVLMNDKLVGEFYIFRSTRIFCSVPEDAIRSSRENVLRLLHPNLRVVNSETRDMTDTRRLCLALEAMEMRPG